ncbi:hypothetical protein NLJ89_g10926 [Agrocybe chaxingu]|uniref:Uncharacterized protein n=1 Tax=Agrocybe chaxingu TaxID=84603 RepID=A0A9W8JQW2_9AGAR|nr:hypothetical protein NLJ89_g10926 [Agrocybe chaxingu]
MIEVERGYGGAFLLSSSSSSSSSTSASSETTTSTTSTPTTTSQVTTTTPPPTQLTTVVTPTVIASLTNSRVSTSASSTLVASATSTAEASTGLSTGAVVGGIGAGIVAIAALGFAVTFFIRRARKREANAFDDHDFRRSAMVLNDPPTHEDTVARGYNPRPPSMVERRLGSSPPPFGNGYDSYNQDYYGDNRAGYGAGYQQPSFNPGQVIGMDNGAPSPMMANSAHPMYPDAAYTQSPFSPIGTPVSEYGQYPGHSQYPDHPSLARQASTVGAYPVLTRQGSQESHHGPHSPPRAPHTQLEQENIPANDYVDLSRASVSPHANA